MRYVLAAILVLFVVTCSASLNVSTDNANETYQR